MRIGVLAAAAFLALGAPVAAGEAKPPTGKALEDLAERYLAATFADRAKMREQADRDFASLDPSAVEGVRAALLKVAAHAGPKIGKSGTNWFYDGNDKEKRRGKYIVSGKPGKTLFIGLHGGGQGSGDAESAAGAMGGGGWWWIFPEVLEKTEHGWTDSGTEEFVMDLIEAAKRTARVDPNRIYITGHSMGGYGTWTLGAHHADVFAGGAAFAGAPSPIWRKGTTDQVEAISDGILPNWFALRLHVYQSLDDKNVPPAANIFATNRLKELQKEYGGGWDFRYEQVDGRAHAPPAEGYLPDLNWVAEAVRNARPKRFLWQPSLPWVRQFYWLYWDRPEEGALLEVKAVEGNAVEILVHQGANDLSGLSVLLGPPLVDLAKEVVVRVDGKERFRGVVPRTISTLLMTLPRNDPDLLFDARVDL
jgi:pimeloyl-ACP methyl ester carboxylesterase